MSATSIALNRFGIGARPDEPAPADPRRWLLDQLGRFDARPVPIAAAAGTAAIATALTDYQREQRAMRQDRPAMPPGGPTAVSAAAPQPLPGDHAMIPSSAPAAPPAMPPRAGRSDAQRDARATFGREIRADYAAAVAARLNVALATDTPFVERLVWFWSNHFAVSIDKLPIVGLAGPMEFDAIRPHVTGRFRDLLTAVERHPAMLVYLDQAVSVGPNSPLGRRAALRPGAEPKRRLGLNENLAREILELHTVGVRTGYTQADVTEFARAMTGWTVAGIGGGPLARQLEGFGTPGQFVFAEPMHEPGARTIMGKHYADRGVDQAQAVLDDVAVAPATARHIATKLARHFAGDAPPAAMVERMTAAFLASDGDLPTLYRALIASPEAWVAGSPKFKTPWEWTVSSYRALGTRQVQAGAVVGLLNQLGQPIWQPGQPVGYDDIAGSWAGPDAVVRRVEAAERFAARAAPSIDARTLAPVLFPAALSPATDQALHRAESPAQALALLLVAPEMMRR